MSKIITARAACVHQSLAEEQSVTESADDVPEENRRTAIEWKSIGCKECFFAPFLLRKHKPKELSSMSAVFPNTFYFSEGSQTTKKKFKKA